MAFINQTDTQGLQFWMQNWLKPVTRKSTDARDQSMIDKSQSVSVPNVSWGLQSTPTNKTLSWWLQSTPVTQTPVKTWPWYDNVNDSIDNKMQDLDRKLANTRWAVFSVWNRLWWIPWLNKPTIGSDFWAPKWAEQTQYTNFAPEVKQQVNNDIIKQQNPITKKSVDDLFADLKAGMPVEEVQNFYKEYAWQEDMITDLQVDIQAGMPQESIKEFYPELAAPIESGEVKGKNPLIRAIWWVWWALRGWIKWLVYEWIGKWAVEMWKNDKEILAREDLDAGDKFARIVIWEWIGKWLFGAIGDTIWGVIEWGAKWFTTKSEREYISQESGKIIKDMIDTAKTNPDIQVIKSKFDALPEQTKKDMMDFVWYATDYANIIWLEAWIKPVLKGVEWWLEVWAKQLDNAVWWLTEKVVKKTTSMFAKKTLTEAEQATIKASPRLADKMLQDTLDFTKPEIRNYRNKFGEEPGTTLNSRWLVKWWDETIDATSAAMQTAKDQKSLWISKVEAKVPVNEDVTAMIERTRDNQIGAAAPSDKVTITSKRDKMLDDAKNWKLSHKDLEEAKATFERSQVMNYDHKTKISSEKAAENTAIDTKVRELQQEELARNWFDNIKDINQEISKNYSLMNMLIKKVDRVWWLSLPDYVLLASSVINPSELALFASKKVAQSWRFKRWMIKLLNKINWKTSITAKVADLQAINKISSEVEFNNFLNAGELKNPALPQVKATPVTSEWLVIPWGKPISPNPTTKPWIIELPNKTVPYYTDTKAKALENLWSKEKPIPLSSKSNTNVNPVSNTTLSSNNNVWMIKPKVEWLKPIK